MNNNVLFNAAYAGAIEGLYSGRGQVGLGNQGLVNKAFWLRTVATAIATEVDSLIAFDAAITTSNVAPAMIAVAASNAQTGPIFAKTQLLRGIAAGMCDGRFSSDSTAADWLPVATQIANAYSACVGNLVTP